MLKKSFVILIIVTIYSLYSPLSLINANGTKKEIDISTSPEKVFFDIKSGRPGDTYIKEIEVKNNGDQDIKYLFSNSFLNGSEKFYNELLLKVEDKNGVIFDGKFKDLQKLDSRELKRHASEILKFNIYIPIELGNEFQNLNSEFQLRFFVDGTNGGVLSVAGYKLPNSATGIYNLLIAGAFLALGGGTFLLSKKFQVEND